MVVVVRGGHGHDSSLMSVDECVFEDVAMEGPQMQEFGVCRLRHRDAPRKKPRYKRTLSINGNRN